MKWCPQVTFTLLRALDRHCYGHLNPPVPFSSLHVSVSSPVAVKKIPDRDNSIGKGLFQPTVQEYTTPPCHLWWVKEMTLPLTSCRTWESRPSTLLGQHIRTDPIDRGAGELALRMWTGPKNVNIGDLALPLTCHLTVWAGEKCPPYSLSPVMGGRAGPKV